MPTTAPAARAARRRPQGARTWKGGLGGLQFDPPVVDAFVQLLEDDGVLAPAAVRAGDAVAHPFGLSCVGTDPGEVPYWRDVGSVDAYRDANIDLTATKPLLNLYDRDWPIWTYQPQTPPAKFVHNQEGRRGMAIESLDSGACIISGSLFRSVLFSGVRVHSYASVNWSVLLPDVQIGRGARLTKVIVDHGVTIPDRMVIGEDPEADAQRFYRSEGGVTLVTQAMLDKLVGG